VSSRAASFLAGRDRVLEVGDDGVGVRTERLDELALVAAQERTGVNGLD